MPVYSIITPTLNAERVLQECLEHLTKQNFPRDQYEIIIADGGSTDRTLDIAKSFGAKIVQNPLKTGEAGKMVGLRHAVGEYAVFLDSDNILTDPEWLNKMKKPFEDPEILATEPIRYDTRPSDHYLTRYFAYMGMGDPINLFLGNYDRFCAISDRWTGLDIKQEQKPGYTKIYLYKDKMPTVGANGFIVRRKLLGSLLDKEYLFDVDVLNMLSGKEEIIMAKVDTGVIHLFSGNISTFMRKQKRRIKDYVYYNSIKMRAHCDEDKRNPILKLLYPGGLNLTGLLLFLASCITIIPLLFQSLIGFIRKPDWVWIVHPLICEITCYVYVTERIKSFFKKSIYDRSKWSQ